MSNHNEQMKQYIDDILVLEKHILETVQCQSGHSTIEQHVKAGYVIDEIERVMSEHIDHLEQHRRSFFDSSVMSSVKGGVSAAVGVGTGLYSELRGSDAVSQMLRDDYTALSMAAISYTMLYTSALAFNNKKISDFALKHLNDITSLVVAISEVMPLVVAKELIYKGQVESDFGEHAREATQRTWQSVS